MSARNPAAPGYWVACGRHEVLIHDRSGLLSPDSTTTCWGHYYCSCLGCWACDGVERDCHCDVDWDLVRQQREDEKTWG